MLAGVVSIFMFVLEDKRYNFEYRSYHSQKTKDSMQRRSMTCFARRASKDAHISKRRSRASILFYANGVPTRSRRSTTIHGRLAICADHPHCSRLPDNLQAMYRLV